jgi:hypothetical protein
VRTSGVRDVALFRSVDGGPFRRVRRTTASSLRVALAAGRRYRFATRARDVAGNLEPIPRAGDAAVRRAR